MAYIMVSRLWHSMDVPLLRIRMVRARAEARLASIAGLSVTKRSGQHGDLVLALVPHQGGTTIGEPVYVDPADARALLLEHFDLTPTMLNHLLAETFVQRRYDAHRHQQAKESPEG